jgi:hypothetical protein
MIKKNPRKHYMRITSIKLLVLTTLSLCDSSSVIVVEASSRYFSDTYTRHLWYMLLHNCTCISCLRYLLLWQKRDGITLERFLSCPSLVIHSWPDYAPITLYSQTVGQLTDKSSFRWKKSKNRYKSKSLFDFVNLLLWFEKGKQKNWGSHILQGINVLI